MHGIHAWTERTPEGEKREIRATKFGGNWQIQSKLRSDEEWTYHNPPKLEDLHELRDILFRKYQRRRAAYEDVKDIEQIIKELEHAQSE